MYVYNCVANKHSFKSCGHVCFVIYMLRNLMTNGTLLSMDKGFSWLTKYLQPSKLVDFV